MRLAYGKITGRLWEGYGKVMGRLWEGYGNVMGDYGKVMGDYGRLWEGTRQHLHLPLYRPAPMAFHSMNEMPKEIFSNRGVIYRTMHIDGYR